MKTLKRRSFFCITFSLLFFAFASAQQDNSLNPGKPDKKEKHRQEKEYKELDKMHQKDKKKLASQFSDSPKYKKDFKVKPAQGAVSKPAKSAQPSTTTPAKTGGGL